eukprot:scaffold6910_cov136-Isochrysis_galbana.AAC.12
MLSEWARPSQMSASGRWRWNSARFCVARGTTQSRAPLQVPRPPLRTRLASARPKHAHPGAP